jgi:type II secretion system protein N
MAFALNLGTREKRILRWVGQPLLAIVAFVFALGWTFPYERLGDRVIDLLAAKYDVTIADVHGTFLPGGVVFESVVLKTRPTQPDEKPLALVFREVELDIGLLPLLIGHKNVDLVATMGSGSIEGTIGLSSGALEAKLETEGLPLADLPGANAAIGLPMAGSLDLDLEIRLPEHKWKNAEGSIKLACNGCSIGDGKAKLKPMKPAEGAGRRRANAFASEGITFPRLDLGETHASISIDKGIGKIEEFAARSKDGWLKIDGRIEFKDPFGQSLMPGCMTFQLSDELRKREPNFSNIELMLPQKARKDDGSFAIPTKGKLSELRWDVRRQCGAGGAEGGDEPTTAGSGRDRARPTFGGGKRGDDDGGHHAEIPPVTTMGGHDAAPAEGTAAATPPNPPGAAEPAAPTVPPEAAVPVTETPTAEAPSEPLQQPPHPEPVAGEPPPEVPIEAPSEPIQNVE